MSRKLLAGNYTQADLHQLLRHESFKVPFWKELGQDAVRVQVLIDANEEMPDDLVDQVTDAIDNSFDGDIRVTLGWDTHGGAGAGAVWIDGYTGGPFRMTSSDIDPAGPFNSLEGALAELDCLLGEGWSSPEVCSDQLPLGALLEIARQIMLFEEGETVIINGIGYVVRGQQLVIEAAA